MNATPNSQTADTLSRDLTPQRRHLRVPFEVEVNVESDHNFYTGFTSNISEGGLFIATSKVKPVGTQLAFNFKLDPFPEPISVYGIVRWIREGSRLTEDAPPGMGVQFQNLHPAVADRINHFIKKSRDTIFYDE